MGAGLINDRHFGGALSIRLVKIAALQEWNSHRREVRRADGPVFGARLVGGERDWPEFDQKIQAGIAAAKREISRHTGGLHSRKRLDALDQTPVKESHVQSGVARFGQSDLRR